MARLVNGRATNSTMFHLTVSRSARVGGVIDDRSHSFLKDDSGATKLDRLASATNRRGNHRSYHNHHLVLIIIIIITVMATTIWPARDRSERNPIGGRDRPRRLWTRVSWHVPQRAMRCENAARRTRRRAHRGRHSARGRDYVARGASKYDFVSRQQLLSGS